MPSSPWTNQRLISVIMWSLVAWGIYVAVGATGIFVHHSLMDLRKSAVVMISLGLFLGLWTAVLWNTRRLRGQAPPEAVSSDRQPRPTWSTAGLLSLVSSGLGAGLWALSVIGWQHVSAKTTTVVGWLAAGLILNAAIASLVALSDRVPRRGKGLGLLGLLVGIGAVIGFFVRMTPS